MRFEDSKTPKALIRLTAGDGPDHNRPPSYTPFTQTTDSPPVYTPIYDDYDGQHDNLAPPNGRSSSPASEPSSPVSESKETQVPAIYLPSTTASTTKYFISQRGNCLRPWPFAHSSELTTTIYGFPHPDNLKNWVPVYVSTRLKRTSGNCVLERVASPAYVAAVTDKDKRAEERLGGSQLEVRTTYLFGPGNDPVVEFLPPGTHEDLSVGLGTPTKMPVCGKGIKTRVRWFEYQGGRYEWRYRAMRTGSGMVLERIVGVGEGLGEAQPPADPPLAELPGSCGEAPAMSAEPAPINGKGKGKGKCKGKGKGKAMETNKVDKAALIHIPVAEFRRDEDEVRKESLLKVSPAGMGGWLTVFDRKEPGPASGEIPHWMIVVTCLVMLKRERDRRTFQVTMAVTGAGAGAI